MTENHKIGKLKVHKWELCDICISNKVFYEFSYKNSGLRNTNGYKNNDDTLLGSILLGHPVVFF